MVQYSTLLQFYWSEYEIRIANVMKNLLDFDDAWFAKLMDFREVLSV